MKTKFKTLFALAALLLASATSASAQQTSTEGKNYPHIFLGLQGGAEMTLFNGTNEVSPIGALEVGSWYNSKVGLRGKAYFWKNKYDNDDMRQTFKYTNTKVSVDFLLDLTNLIKENRKVKNFSTVWFVGAGINMNWAKDVAYEVTDEYPNGWAKQMRWDGTRHNVGFSANTGFRFQYDILKWLGVNVEVAGHYNGHHANNYANNLGDWQFTALAGVVFNLGQKSGAGKKKVVVPPTPVRPTLPAQKAEPKPAQKPAQKPAAKKPAETKPAAPAKRYQETVFFGNAVSELTAEEDAKLKELAQWMNENPGTYIYLTGYADATTGNPELNMEISKKRVEAVANVLKEKYGIKEARIHTSYKGDTVQPYSTPERNRCVVLSTKK
ncbi:MAG: OmpA family protein [Bacteroidales bacterium]|nr:OmpA family protein [Bacteroidales bacterium]